MKNGVPISAVRMPSGISIGAAVRASVSITSRKPPPSSAAAGISRAKSGPTSVRAMMRHHQADPADDAGGGDARRRHQRCGGDDGDAQRPGGTPSARASSSGSDITFIRQRSASSTSGAERDRAEQRNEIGGVGRGEAAEQPERHRGKLVIGIGEIFHQADAGAEQRADHHAGQHQHQDRVARAHRRADQIDRGDRDQPADEGERLDREHAEREDRCRAPRRAPRRTTRRGCRATPADCGTGPGTRCRRPRAPRRPARRPARAARAPARSRSRPPPARPAPAGELGEQTWSRSPGRPDSGRP